MNALRNRSRTSSKTGRFFVVSAPSGAGKTTLVSRLLQDFPDLECSVSFTTRPPREAERQGIDYQFVDEKKFREMIDRDLFFEWEEVHGFLYGTPKEPLLRRRDGGRDTILDIDVRGALTLKKAFPDSCLIFLMPPTVEVLEQRLRRRRTEGESSLRKRLENARREMGEKEKFNYVIINDEIERALGELRKIVRQER